MKANLDSPAPQTPIQVPNSVLIQLPLNTKPVILLQIIPLQNLVPNDLNVPPVIPLEAGLQIQKDLLEVPVIEVFEALDVQIEPDRAVVPVWLVAVGFRSVKAREG